MLAKCRSLASAVAFRVTAYIGGVPYRQVVATLREFLPVSETLNHVTVRNRALRAGMRIDGVERASSDPSDSDTQWTLAIDGGFAR